MKLQAFLVAATLVAFSGAAPCQRHTAAQACFDEGGQVQARECLEDRFRTSEAELKNAEAASLAALGHWQEAPANRAKSLKALKESAIAFHRYRTKQCALQASLTAGGTGTGHRRLLCAIELNQRRIADLRSVEMDAP